METGNMAVTESFTIKQPEYDCPKCGVVTSVVKVTYGDPYLDGDYCQRCLIRWAKEFVPKVTLKK